MDPDSDEHAVAIPIEDALDLHTFQPREAKELLDDYLQAAFQKGFREVLIVHGKGEGILRRRVQGILLRHPLVFSIYPADALRGGWGATVAVLRSRSEHLTGTAGREKDGEP